MEQKFKIDEAIKFIQSVEGKYSLGDEGRIDNAYTNEQGEYVYNVKSAGNIVSNVPETDMEFAYSGIDKNVDSYLRENESAKSFKDSDVRVGGSRKEMMAYKNLINIEDLNAIEKDSVTAKTLIKKDKVYPKINTAEQIDKGVSGGCLYLKMKVRDFLGNTPPDTAEYRKLYVGLAQWLYDLFDDAITIEDFHSRRKHFVNGVVRKSLIIANPEIQPELEKQNWDYQEQMNNVLDYEKNKDDIKNKMTDLGSEAGIKSWELDKLALAFPKEHEQWKYWSKLYEIAYRHSRNKILPLEYKFLHGLATEQGNKKISLLTKKDISIGIYVESDWDYITNYSDDVVKDLIVNVFGEKFYMFIQKYSNNKTTYKSYEDAQMYEAFSQDDYEVVYEREIKPYDDKIERMVKATEFILNPEKTIKEKTEYVLGEARMGGWGYGSGKNRLDLKDLLTQFDSNGRRNRRYDIEHGIRFMREVVEKDWGFPKIIAETEVQVAELKEKYVIRENNYSFLEEGEKKERKKGIEKITDLVINSGVPLSYIKRDGGVAVYDTDLDDSDKVLSFYKNRLGITGVTYGKSLPDDERKAHSRHFAAAMIDLAETLNWDVKSLTGLGGLGIKFAASGTGRAAAHYEPDRIAINLTRSSGDGTVAHEMLHYIDHQLPKKFPKDGKSEKNHAVYGSFTKGGAENISNANINAAMVTLMSFIKKGVPVNKMTLQLSDKINKEHPIFKQILPLLPEFISSVLSTTVTVRIESSKSTVRTKHGNIEESIAFYKGENQYPNYFDYGYYIENIPKVKKFLGAIVETYGLPYYDFQLTNKPKNRKADWDGNVYTSTAFYLKSEGMPSDYWSYDWEIAARSFEKYVYMKMAKYGRSNNYLVSGTYFDRAEGVYPFSVEAEIIYIMYDHLFNTIKEELNIKDFVPFRDARVNEYILLNDDDTEKRKLIVDEVSLDVIESTEENAKLKDEAVKLMEELILLLSDKKEFEDGGEINSGVVDSLFTFSKYGI
jgi:hypothetical protein